MEESIIGQDSENGQDFQVKQSSSTSDMADSSIETARLQVGVLVDMRKHLHRILIKLDQLEDQTRQIDRNQEPRNQVKQYGKASTLSQTRSERQNEQNIKNHEKNKETDQGGLRAAAIVLFIITIVIIGGSFIALAIFNNPSGIEKLQAFGFTYDQIKSMVYWLVPIFYMNLATWIIFGLAYIQKNGSNKFR
jgi:Na+/H+ antiporter NhaC